MYQYKLGNYERVAQKFIIPIHIKDYDDSIKPSSTATIIKYLNRYFIIIAAHATNYNEENLKRLGVILNDGEFDLLINVDRNKYKIYKNEDVIIIECYVPGRAFFDLDDIRNSVFLKLELCWIGFPSNNSIILHKTKQSKEKVIANYITYDGINTISKTATYYLLQAGLFEITDSIVTAKYTNKNIDLKVAGKKPDGISLKGMSGGAIFLRPSGNIDDLNKRFKLEDFNIFKHHFYQFAGIGLEYSEKNELIKGISKNKLQDLIKDFIQARQ